MSVFPIGAYVELCGLQRTPELNGQHGIVVPPLMDAVGDRLYIRLGSSHPWMQNPERIVSARCGNLCIVPQAWFEFMKRRGMKFSCIDMIEKMNAPSCYRALPLDTMNSMDLPPSQATVQGWFGSSCYQYLRHQLQHQVRTQNKLKLLHYMIDMNKVYDGVVFSDGTNPTQSSPLDLANAGVVDASYGCSWWPILWSDGSERDLGYCAGYCVANAIGSQRPLPTHRSRVALWNRPLPSLPATPAQPTIAMPPPIPFTFIDPFPIHQSSVMVDEVDADSDGDNEFIIINP